MSIRRYQIFSVPLLAVSAFAHAVEYECLVDEKWDIFGTIEYTSEYLVEFQFSVLIEETIDATFISRCSFPPGDAERVCERYAVDLVELTEEASLKKFYVTRSQSDVQLFSDLTFLENNGRGTLATGVCAVVSP